MTTVHPRLLFVLVFLLSGFLTLPAPIWAQEESQDEQMRLVQVDYMKVAPDRIEEYISMEREIWKPMHQERAKDDKIQGWYLYTVRYPAGTGHDYNFITVTEFDNLENVENPDFETYAQRVHPDMIESVATRRTNQARKMVRSELWTQHDALAPEQSPSSPPSFFQLDYMKVAPGGESGYVDLEQTVWKPVHQARLDAGLIASWSVYEMILPGGSNQPHNFGTVTTFNSMADMSQSYPENVWEQVHPDKNVDELMQQTMDARDLVQTELWELIDSVPGPATQASR